jgi:prepilin-type N-terminal cleavage/methylation domain-containing protein
MKRTSCLTSHRAGFTLVELLVTITIIVVLASLTFMGTSVFLKRAAAVKDMTNMKNLWTGVHLYAGDNNDSLPGPLNAGQKAIYGASAGYGRINFYLASYLGYTDPKDGDFLESMASNSWQKTPATKAAPCYYIRSDVPTDVATVTIKPWGYPTGATADRRPMKMSAALSRINTSRTWAITDVDQLHPDIGSAAWKADVPEKMAHGSYRLAIYFDGSGGKVNRYNVRQ